MARLPACALFLGLASAQDLFLAQRGNAQAHCCYSSGCDADLSTCSVGYCAESEANCKGCGGTFCPDGPSPTPTPSPPPPSPPSPAPTPPAPPAPPSPAPTPPPPAPAGGDIIGWYAKNWGDISPRPAEGPNNAFLFVGTFDFPSVIQNCMGWTNDCKKAADDASVKHWLVVGGDTSWSKEMISVNIAYVKANGADLKQNYPGISYDIEQLGSTDGELVDDIAELLKVTKDAGLGTMITMSWSGPLQADGYRYTTAWASDSNLDYLSPQIYSRSMDAPYSMANPPITNACPKCAYEIFKDKKPIVVSIEVDGDYQKLEEGFFAHQSGYILWGN